MFVKLAFVDDKLAIEAVAIETLPKEAFFDSCRVLLMFVKLAFVTDRFTIEAVVIETLSNEAYVDS